MSELYLPTPDYFEQERPLQPKRVVADYVETRGILVPRRFETFEEAQFAAQQGIPVIARSEHPDEYSGPSGLGYSSPFELASDGSMKPRHYKYEKDTLRRYRHYAEVSGAEEPERYIAQASESYWEAIPGINVTCIADDAVEGQYHVFGFRYKGRNGNRPTLLAGAIVRGDGEVVRLTDRGEEIHQFIARFKDIIDLYNQIRNLDRFNPSHCPVMEMQLADEDGKLYFLQYHRARDAAPVSERLQAADYEERDGWVEADVVRGAYLGDKVLQLAMWYRGLKDGNTSARDMQFPEDGSTNMDVSFYTLDELIARQRTAHLIPSTFEREYDKIASNHGPRSRMFKPRVSMITNPPQRYDYISAELSREAAELAIRENKEVRIKTDVISDGRTGYFRYSDELVVTD